MRAVVYAGARNLVVEQLAAPHVGPNDLLLEIEACGVCGSDVASYFHGHYVVPGQVLGHEMSARIAVMGSSISGVKVGQRVAVRPSRSCGTCSYCRGGTPYLCGESGARTLGYGLRGAYADFVLIPDAVVGSDVIVVPDDLPPEEVLWVEPLAVAVHAIRLAEANNASSLLVIGSGSVGLCVIAAATAAGVQQVVVVEPRENRRAAATSLGALAFAPSEFHLANKFSIVLDTSGSVAAITSAKTHLQPGGRLVLVGLGDGEIPWPIPSCQVVGSFAYTDADFGLALSHLVAGRVSLARFVTHRYELANTADAIVASAENPTVIKAAIFPLPKLEHTI